MRLWSMAVWERVGEASGCNERRSETIERRCSGGGAGFFFGGQSVEEREFCRNKFSDAGDLPLRPVNC